MTVTVGATAPGVQADPLLTYDRNTYGMPGLIDMPTAEVRPDAEFAVSMTNFAGTQRNNITFQIAPRLIGAFRYSRVPGLLYNGPNEANTALYDRSFDLHFAAIDEGTYTPAIAIGLRDFVGTGVYSSEYIVATKSITPRLRATAGIGWGRLGSFGGHSGIGDRPAYDNSSNGGQFNSSQWFKGDWAPFFGLSYQINDTWTVKAEYSSDAYVKETEEDGFERKSAFNLAANYHMNEYLDLEMFYLYGSKVGFQIAINVNPKEPTFPSGIEAAPLPVKPRPSPSADPEGWSGVWASDPTAEPAIQKVLAGALKKEGMILESMSLNATRIDMRIRNIRFMAQAEAIGRAARIATRALPPSVETIVITPMGDGMPLSAVTVHRTDLEQYENTGAYSILNHVQVDNAPPRDPAQVPTAGAYPYFVWSLGPYTSVSFFDPDQPIRIDVGAELAARYEAAPGLVFTGSLRQKIAGDVGDGRLSNTVSSVPRVRTDSTLYAQHGDLTIPELQSAYYAKLSDDVYARITAGMLEQMYGGVSGEVLWQPVDSRLALGVETNWVKKRAYDQRFDFLDYSTFTGHASAYYDFGKGYVGELDVGRYLARDWGATVSLDRTFANGWKVGAFATVTNMSSEDFGEGSFDKGISLTIPISWATGTPSLTTVDSTIRPLTRDGGARLNVDGRLYDVVNPAQTGGLYDGWGRFWR